LSGFFVLRRECIAGIKFQEAGFKLLLEILARGRITSVAEVPFKFSIRKCGRSKANAMTAVHYFLLLCKLAANRVRLPKQARFSVG
jgi:dolichol-phosphate mannosyltransferase